MLVSIRSDLTTIVFPSCKSAASQTGSCSSSRVIQHSEIGEVTFSKDGTRHFDDGSDSKENYIAKPVSLRRDPVIWSIATIVGIVLLPALGATFEQFDDHNLIRIATSQRVHAQILPAFPLLRILVDDATIKGRFYPLVQIQAWLRAKVFGYDAFYDRLTLIGMAIATTFLIYGTMLNSMKDRMTAAVFTLSLMLCPAAHDLWPHFCRGEHIGMLLTSASLYCLSRSGHQRNMTGFDVVALIAFLLACLTKESFFLLAPALIWFRWQGISSLEGASGQPPAFPRIGFAFVLVAFLTGVAIAATLITASAGNQGSRSLHLTVERSLRALAGPGGIASVVLENSFCFIPLIVATAVWLLGATKKFPVNSKTIVFAGLVIIPQTLLYSTRSGFEARYAFPLLLGCAAVNAIALQSVLMSEMQTVKIGVLLVGGVWLLRFAQVQFTESLNLTAETSCMRRMVEDVAHNIPESGTVVVVAPPKTEAATSFVIQLGMLGRPNSRVYVRQPAGSDGDTEFGFTGYSNSDPVANEDVDCVVFLLDKAACGPSPLYENAHFTMKQIECCKYYVSFRRGQIVAVPQLLEYAFRNRI